MKNEDCRRAHEWQPVYRSERRMENSMYSEVLKSAQVEHKQWDGFLSWVLRLIKYYIPHQPLHKAGQPVDTSV